MNFVDIADSDSQTPLHPASSLDFLPRGQLRGLQSQRLRQSIARVWENVPLYRQRMHKHGITPESVRGMDDLRRLPLTTWNDLADEYPFGMLAVRLGEVVRLNVAGRAPGKPTLIAHGKRDLEARHEVIVRSLACCGIRQGDLVLNACGHDLFTDGLGLHAGIEALGAAIVASSTGDRDRQIAVLKDVGVSAICCTPGYLLHLLARAENSAVALRELPLRTVVLLTETWSEDLRRQAEQAAGVKAYGFYGLPEILAPGVGAECACQEGLHLFEDHFYPEIIDPQTGRSLPDGEEGELVLTTLMREAMPLIRYRTSDRTAILTEPCRCGRSLRRIRRIERRDEESWIVEGVQVYQKQIEAVLQAVGGTLPPYRVVLLPDRGLDRLEVQVEVTAQIFRDQVGAMESLQDRLAQEIERAVGVRVPVRFVEPHAITRSHGESRTSRT